MDQKTIAVLLGTTRRNVTYHLNNKFESGELSEEENTINPNDGKNTSIIIISPKANTQPILYNFEAILTIAFSVSSKRALEVRRWAKKVLSTFVVDGVVVDKERVLNDKHTQNKLDQIVGEMRSRGNDLIKASQDIFSGVQDYNPGSEETSYMMANFTNSVLNSISNMTSGELLWYRSDADAPNVGMTTYTGKKGPTLVDAGIGTNFLTNDEHKKRYLIMDNIYTTILNFKVDHDNYSMQDIFDFNLMMTIMHMMTLVRQI